MMNSSFKKKGKKLALLLLFALALSTFAAGCTNASKLGKTGNGSESSTTVQSTSSNDNSNSTSNTTTQNSSTAVAENGTQGDSGNDGSEVTLNGQSTNKDIKVKALYLTGWTVGSMTKVKHFVDLANTTELNSYVIDVKDDDGLVGYESQIPAVREIGGWTKKYNVDKVLKEFHDNNVHIIGRIVCFKDPILSAKRPDLAVKTKSGAVWKDTHGKPWINPNNKDSWPYIIDIAKEAVNKGFDEIQFDYVRFPNDGTKNADFGNGDKPRYEVINEFLSYARKELPGVTLSADIFGIVCESPSTTGDSATLGQNLETVGKEIDYISPMAYPSHYALGQTVNGVEFRKPDLEPYGVVYNTLVKAKNRIAKVAGYKAQIRPYIQDFTATWVGKGNYQTYGPEQLRQQIKAVTDAGLDQWIFWDAGNTYSESGLAKDNN